MKNIALHWKILMAMAMGIIWSLFAVSYGLNDITADWIQPFGTIFINILKFIAIPLVLFSIVSGVANLVNPAQLGKMGLKTLGLYLITTLAAVSIGLLVANLLNPGNQSNPETKRINRLEYEIWATQNGYDIKDDQNLLANATPKEIAKVEAKMKADLEKDDYKEAARKKESAQKSKDAGPLQFLVDMVPSNLIIAFSDGTLMIQVIFFALFFGITLALMPKEKTTTVRSFFEGMNDVFIDMVHIVMKASPFFVFCLMAGVLAKSADTLGDLGNIFISLGFYTVVVVGGLVFMLFVFYPALLKISGTKIGYRQFFRAMSPAQFLAFSTSSSAATLPVTIECVNENLKVPEKVSDFVLPIGATVNMDGTSLYQAVAVIFLAQYHDVDLSLMQQIGILGTATLASIGAAAVPSAGLIMLMIVLSSVGLNPLWIAIIMPVDRILDMCRTVINVTSDATVAAIIAKNEMKGEA